MHEVKKIRGVVAVGGILTDHVKVIDENLILTDSAQQLRMIYSMSETELGLLVGFFGKIHQSQDCCLSRVNRVWHCLFCP